MATPLTPEQLEARNPSPQAGEPLVAFLDRTWSNAHEAALPRWRTRYQMAAADRLIRGVLGVGDRIADELGHIGGLGGRIVDELGRIAAAIERSTAAPAIQPSPKIEG